MWSTGQRMKKQAPSWPPSASRWNRSAGVNHDGSRGETFTIHSLLHPGLPVSSLREIAALQQLDHPNVVKLLCVAAGRSLNSVYLIMEYCEHDLASLIDNMPTPFPEPAVKCLMKQLLDGLNAMHIQVYQRLGGHLY